MNEMSLRCTLKSSAYNLFHRLALEADAFVEVRTQRREVDFLAEKRRNNYGPCDNICKSIFRNYFISS